MASPPVAAAAEEKADNELDKLRDRLLEESKDLTSGIRRFQIVSLIALAFLCVLLSNDEFRPRKWSGLEHRLAAWEERNKMRGPIRRLPYNHIETYELQEAYRKPLTDSILRTTVANEIPSETNLLQVSQFLGDRYYGVDFLYLHNVEESLSTMSEIVGAKVLKDLSNYDPDGRPLKKGVSLKGWFFSDNVLLGHRLLAERLPYEPEEGVQEYVKSARTLIGEIKQKYPDADREWAKQRVGFRNDIRGWPWIAWANLSDSTVSEWKSLLTESVGAVNEATLTKLGPSHSYPDWGSVIDWLKNQVAEQAKAEREADAKATFWSITFSVPLRVIVMLFPLIFAGARCALAELRLYLRLNLARITAIDALIDRGLGSCRTVLERLRAPSMEPPVALSGWNTLRIFPLLFTEIAFEVAASLMAAYVLYRGIRLAYFFPAGWINSVLYSVMIIAATVLGLSFAKTSRSATKALSDRLTVKT